VIPSGIPEWLFERPPSGEQVRQSLGLSGKRIVGYVGSFQPWHDLGGLLVAFGELAGREPDLHLVLVGKGPKRRAIEARVEELGLEARVTFTGNVPHDLVPEYLAAMDISVVPWKPDEDFFFSPMKLFESMAAGTATIAAALGDIPRVVAHGSNGLLYDPSDPSSLRAALAELISKPGLQAELAEAARITASGYTWGGVAEKVEELARSLIRRHPLPQRTGGP
jgi:glycosyltransferase involved in cell wall biosynthesis